MAAWSASFSRLSTMMTLSLSDRCPRNSITSHRLCILAYTILAMTIIFWKNTPKEETFDSFLFFFSFFSSFPSFLLFFFFCDFLSYQCCNDYNKPIIHHPTSWSILSSVIIFFFIFFLLFHWWIVLSWFHNDLIQVSDTATVIGNQ